MITRSVVSHKARERCFGGPIQCIEESKANKVLISMSDFLLAM